MLHSSATCGAWSVLKQASDNFSPVNTGTLFPADAYLCRVPYVRSIEKLIKLKKSMIYEKNLLKWDTSYRQKMLYSNFWCSLSRAVATRFKVVRLDNSGV